MEAESLRSSGTLQGLSSYQSACCHIPERRNMECVRYAVRRKTRTVVCNTSRPVPVLMQYDVGKKHVLNTLKHCGNYMYHLLEHYKFSISFIECNFVSHTFLRIK